MRCDYYVEYTHASSYQKKFEFTQKIKKIYPLLQIGSEVKLYASIRKSKRNPFGRCQWSIYFLADTFSFRSDFFPRFFIHSLYFLLPSPYPQHLLN